MFNVDDIRFITDERLKMILSEVFDNIIIKYGEENFLRWINESRIDGKIKTLIVKYMANDEFENAGGYYSRQKNVLAVRPSYGTDRTTKVITHEFNHFLTAENFKSEMTGFINEGITEYLTQKVESRGYKTYRYNVDFVSFLHKQIGDILIKSYFTGETSKVKSKLETYLSPKINLGIFLDRLKSIYDKCYDEPFDACEKIIASEMGFFADSYMQIYLGKIIEDANKMKYYSNGNIDQVSISQAINDISSMFPDYVIQYMNEHNLMTSYKESIVRSILNSSHLRHLDYYGNDNIKEYVDAIMNGKVIDIPNNNAIQLLLLDKLKNVELNINEYADVILLVINKFPNFNIEDLNKMEFLIDKVGEEKFKIVYEYVVNNVSRYSNVNEFVNEHERNTIESQFRVIVPNWYYLEKRDNKFYIIKMDANGKVVEDIPIEKQYGETFFISELFLTNDEGKLCVPSITLDEDFSKIKIYPEVSRECKEVYDLDDFQKLIKIMPFIEKIKSRLKKNAIINNDNHEPFYGVDGVYYQINSSGVRAYDDYRTIRLDINGLRKDFAMLNSFFPKNDNVEMIIGILKDTLRDIYEVDYSLEVDWCAKMLYEILCNGRSETILLDIEDLLNCLKQDKNNFVKKKYELSFKDEETKQEYARREEAYKAKTERRSRIEALKKEKELKKAEEIEIRIFESQHQNGYLKYERIPQHLNPMAQFDLPAVKLVQPTREPGFATIDVGNLIVNMKSYMVLCKGKKDCEPYIVSTIKSAIENFLEIIDTEEGKELFNSLYIMIYNAIFGDDEIDMISFEKLINRSNEYISNHAMLWPVEVNPNRERMAALLNELYQFGNIELFEKIVKTVREYVLINGYDENLYNIISGVIGMCQFNGEEEHKKKV